MNRFTRAMTAALLVVTLVAAPVSAATSDISASMHAYIEGNPVQVVACPGYAEGQTAAAEHERGTGWLIGGLLAPPAGLMAGIGAPGGPGPSMPAVELLAPVPAEEQACFIAGYGETSQGKKRRMALIGGAVGSVVYVVFVAVVISAYGSATGGP